MKYIIALIVSIGILHADGAAQSYAEEYQRQYDANIQRAEINGVYIPTDINDAMRVLDEKASDRSKAKIREGKHEIVVKNLSRGLGKWMIVNWNFYAGSRLSHVLRQSGVTHPDDMASYIVETYYRHLMGLDYELDTRAETIRERRRKAQEEENKKRVVVHR